MGKGRHIRSSQEEKWENSAPKQAKTSGGPKRFYITMGLLCVLVAALTICAVFFLRSTGRPPAEQESEISSSEEMPDSSFTESADEQSSSAMAEASSEQEDVSSQQPESISSPHTAASSQPEQSVVPADFDENGIDALLAQAMAGAGNNLQMVEAYEDAAQKWEKEIDREVGKLAQYVQEPAVLREQQEQWE